MRGQGKQILSDAERESIIDQKKELEDTLSQAEDYGKGTAAEHIDKGVIQRQINNLERVLHDGRQPRLTGAQKDSLAKEAAQLETQFQDGLPTRYEMDHPAKCPGAVRKHLRWVQRNSAAADRYRHIQRALGEHKSIESLRKDR